MKTLLKKSVSLFIAFVLMLSLCVTTYFAADGDIVEGVVINTDDTSVVSNIKIDVYSLTSVYTDTNQTDYDKQFAFSVFTDSNGEFSFVKPTSQCVVEIDETTVADGYGVLTGADILGADNVTAELSISALATYEIDFEDNSIQFYNAQDDALVVKENINSDALSNVQLRSTEPETANLLANDDLAPVGASYINEETYTNGFFTYHYESGALTDRELQIFANQFNYTKASLCYTYCLREPKPKPGKSTYDVYYVYDPQMNPGVTFGSYSYTYIKINLNNLLDLEPTEENYQQKYDLCIDSMKKTISHELMHGVQLAYEENSGADYRAYNESVCELSALAFSGLLYSSWIADSQLTPELSLFDNGETTEFEKEREYSLLFPYYLYENFSQFNVIRKIYEEYSEVKNIYLALDNVLSEQYNTSLIDEYIDFRVWAYDVNNNSSLEDNFDITLPATANSPKKTDIVEDVVYYTTPKLSTIYFEKESDEDMYFTFYFALQGTTTASQVNLTSIYTSPDGDVTVTEYPFNTNLKMVNVDMEEGSKICFLMSNINITDTDIQFYCCVYE
ncbi:MAG: hypothetical protein E7563_06595 [Ruminococcaceae bacterium]|nr:hypothetical protein [Oscillospiraceae bacterium]